MPPLDRHAALADPSRRALLDVLRGAQEPQDVRTLAAAVGLHANSTREQLARLAEAGLVRVSTAAPAGRGRPGLRYTAAPVETDDPFRALAGALVDQLAGMPDAARASEAAGARWGRRAAAALSGEAAAPAGAMDAVVQLLAEAGFAPDPAAPGSDTLTLRACPFLPLAPGHLDVVCGVHLGYLRGALDELESSMDATSIHPFSSPGACTARLEARPDA